MPSVPNETRSTSTSQSLERGLAILSTFTSERPLLGISELSRELGLSRSTTHRYVATLARLGYLRQDADSKRYRLGPRVLDLGFAVISSMDLREVSSPHLRELSDATGFTVNLAILDGTDIVYVDRCRAGRPVRLEVDLDLHVGARLPAYCTAMGKAIVAFLPEQRREELIARIDFRPRGPNTLTSAAAFRGALAEIRRSGIAVNNEELAYGLRSIAAPIHSRSGEVVAALNLAVHRTMVSMDELVTRYGPAVRKTATEIAAGLGHSPAAAR